MTQGPEHGSYIRTQIAANCVVIKSPVNLIMLFFLNVSEYLKRNSMHE